MKSGGMVGVLQIVFLVLKLAGVVTWSWLWVLAPLWISVLFTAVVLGIFGAFFAGVFIVGLLAVLLD